MAVEWRKCNKLSWALCDGNCSGCNISSTSFTIDPSSPSIKHGHWETDERYPWRGVCSECHMYITYDMDSNAEMNYCPNCGAMMDKPVK